MYDSGEGRNETLRSTCTTGPLCSDSSESVSLSVCDCHTHGFSSGAGCSTGTSSSYTASAQQMSKKQSFGACKSCSSSAPRHVTSKSTSRNELSKIHIGCEGSSPAGPGITGTASARVGLEESCVSAGLCGSFEVDTGKSLGGGTGGGLGGWKKSIGVGERGGSGWS